jgi:hypothetical protein
VSHKAFSAAATTCWWLLCVVLIRKKVHPASSAWLGVRKYARVIRYQAAQKSNCAAIIRRSCCIGFLSAVVFLLLVNWSVDLHSLASLKWCRKLALLLDFKPDVSVSLLLVAHTQTASYDASDLFTVSLHYGTLLYITSSTQKQKWEPHSGGNGRLIGFQCKSEGQAWCSHVCISLIR